MEAKTISCINMKRVKISLRCSDKVEIERLASGKMADDALGLISIIQQKINFEKINKLKTYINFIGK